LQTSAARGGRVIKINQNYKPQLSKLLTLKFVKIFNLLAVSLNDIFYATNFSKDIIKTDMGGGKHVVPTWSRCKYCFATFFNKLHSGLS